MSHCYIALSEPCHLAESKKISFCIGIAEKEHLVPRKSADHASWLFSGSRLNLELVRETP